MTVLLLVLALVACDRPTPEQVAMSAALESWRQGSALLEAGDPEGARDAFSRGLQANPGDPILSAWDAKAAAQSGDLVAAISRSREVVNASPNFGEARYNLAAYLARNGALDESAAQLALALEVGARRPRDVLADPDFQPHLQHAAFGFLPTTGLVVAVEGPQGPIFWGSQGTLKLRIAGLDDHRVQVEAPAVVAPIELVGVVEDHLLSTDGKAVDLTWTFKAVGAGSFALGPFVITAGPHGAEAGAIGVVTNTPEGRETPKTPPVPFVFSMPTQLGGTYADGTAHRIDGGIAIRGKASDRVEMTPTAKTIVQYDVRVGGQPEWTLRHYTGFDTVPETVTIVRGDQTLFDGRPLD